MEIVNEAEFYTLHPFAVQSEVQIEDREKQVKLFCSWMHAVTQFGILCLPSVICNHKD